MVSEKILQIVVAQPGWVARFKQDDGSISESHVAVWAIIIKNGEFRVTGFSETPESSGFLSPDDEVGNFEGWALATTVGNHDRTI